MTGLTERARATGNGRGATGDTAAGAARLRARLSLRAATSASAVALATLGFYAAAASAGEYQIDFCKDWNTDEPAAQLSFTHSYIGVNNGCYAGGPGGGLHAMLPGGIMQFDSNTGVALQVPADRAGITIRRVWTKHSVSTPGGSLAFVHLWAGDMLLDNDVAPQQRSDDRLLPSGTRSLKWSIFCSTSASTHCFFPAPGDVQHIYKAKLFLIESVDPSLAVTGGVAAGQRCEGRTANARAGRERRRFRGVGGDREAGRDGGWRRGVCVRVRRLVGVPARSRRAGHRRRHAEDARRATRVIGNGARRGRQPDAQGVGRRHDRQRRVARSYAEGRGPAWGAVDPAQTVAAGGLQWPIGDHPRQARR
jgi:hypothetical protein